MPGLSQLLKARFDRNMAIGALGIFLVIPDREMLRLRNMPTYYQMVPFAISTE